MARYMPSIMTVPLSGAQRLENRYFRLLQLTQRVHYMLVAWTGDYTPSGSRAAESMFKIM